MAAGGVAVLLRGDFYADKARTASWFGAICAATSTGTMALMLKAKGLVGLTGGEIGLRMAGSAVLGSIVVPVLFVMMRGLERRLGIWEEP